MSEPNHTPGPWEPCKANDGHCVCGTIWGGAGGETCVATVSVRACPVEDHEHYTAPDTAAKANTRLICAAPDLLAACWDALASLRIGEIDSAADSLWDAVHKAEGDGT